MCSRGHSPSWIACRVIENAPLMIAWLAMIVAKRGEHHQRHLERRRTQHEEWIGVGRNPAFDHRGRLSRIIEQQHGKDKTIPGEADRPGTEVAHIGIERFGAGSTQEHRAENQEAGKAVGEQIGKAIARIERDQHAGWVITPPRPSTPIAMNHTVMIGPEQFSNSRAALRLQREDPTRTATESGTT